MFAEENFGLPPTYKIILRRLLPKGQKKVLDLGCGAGVAAETLNQDKKSYFIGIDGYEPYLEICRKRGFYNELRKQDLRKISLESKSVDTVLLLQVVEHLKKTEATQLIKESIKAAKQAVIISVPNGECFQDDYDDNKFHKHLSSWSSNDLKDMGFKVYGQGLKVLYGDKSYGGGVPPNWWQRVVIPLSIFLSPLVYFCPNLAVQLVAKYSKND
jgi:predicted TPR repeat methyltransferase